AYGVFTLFPVVQTVRLSFYDWDGITSKTWRGVGNYTELFHSSEIRSAFGHSVELILRYAAFSIATGLFLSALLTHFRVRGLTFGLVLILLLAGAQRIPPELYEAARVDGAGFVREFFAVTLPGVRNELLVATTLTTITALRNFDIVYNTTSGGPAGRTEVPSWLMFHDAFEIHRVGLAAAIATVLTVIISLVALGISRFYATEGRA